MDGWSNAKIARDHVRSGEQKAVNQPSPNKNPHPSNLIILELQGKWEGKDREGAAARRDTQSATENKPRLKVVSLLLKHRICTIMRKLQRNRGKLINSPTCVNVTRRLAQRAMKKYREEIAAKRSGHPNAREWPLLPATRSSAKKQRDGRRGGAKGARDPEGRKSSAIKKPTRMVTPVDDGTTDEEKEIGSSHPFSM